MTGILSSVGAFLAGTAVALGAFGAHGLRNRFKNTPELMKNWETAAQYQLVHGIAILTLSSLHVTSAAMTLTVGTILFCGSLYAYALTERRPMARGAPVGGALLLLGWLWAAFALAVR